MVLPETNEQKNLSSAHRELSIIGCRAPPAAKVLKVLNFIVRTLDAEMSILHGFCR